jgi:hypothetical protein
MTGPAAVHPPQPPKSSAELIAEELEGAMKGAAARFRPRRPKDPYKKAHPGIDKVTLSGGWAALIPAAFLLPAFWPVALGVWSIAATTTYVGNKAFPENKGWQNARFLTFHPMHSRKARKIAMKAYRDEHYRSVWKDLLEKASGKIKARTAKATRHHNFAAAWAVFYEYTWLTSKFCAFGANFYLANAVLRRIGFNVGFGVKRKEVKFWLGRDRSYNLPVRPTVTKPHLVEHRKAGLNGRVLAADMYYVKAQAPRQNYGWRQGAREAHTAVASFFSEMDDPGPEAPTPDTLVHPTVGTPADPPTVDLAGSPAPSVATPPTPAAPEPPAPAAAEPVAAEPPAPEVVDQAAADRTWQHLTPGLQQAISQDFAAYREFTDAYSGVLGRIAGLEASEGPGRARQLATEVLEGLHPNPLLEPDPHTLQLLNSVYQIATSPKGTRLTTMQELAKATVEGRPTRAQMGVTFGQVRSAVMFQLGTARASAPGLSL